MKKLFFVAFIALISLVSVNAQTIIKNNYDGSTSTTQNKEKASDSFSSFNLQYITFDGGENYGFTDYFINPNRIGSEFGFRSSFKKHGNYNFDLGINYALELTNSDKFGAFIVLAAGPTFRMQDKFDKLDKYNNPQYKTSFNVDCYINPRLSLKVSHVILSAGYYYWAPKFKFSKDDGAIGGLNIALGFSF